MRYTLLIPFLLVGCGLFSEPEVVTQEVQVPVPAPCVNESEIPDEPDLASESLQISDYIGRKVQALLIDRKALEKAFTESRALLVGCADQS